MAQSGRKFHRVLLGSALAVGLLVAGMTAAPALAQDVSFTVVDTRGDVLVARGGQVYTVAPGDRLFAGDTIFTRQAAEAVIEQLGAAGCNLSLAQASTVTLPVASGAGCALTPNLVQSIAATEFAGVTIGGGATAGIGATPLFAVGLLGGGVLLAGGDDGPSSP
jgi:hypothetical protein